MLLSELLDEMGELEHCKIYNEKKFDVLARITSAINGKRCIFLSDRGYIRSIPDDTTMVITNEEFLDDFIGRNEGICICENPRAIFHKILNYQATKFHEKKVTVIGKDCIISENAYIDPYNVIVEDGVVIEEFACIYEGSHIGSGCIIHAGAKIGIQDYNYFIEEDSITHLKHVGKTVLQDNVEIGYNSVIGRALYSYNHTFVGRNCKIGNGVLIGHDSRIEDMSKIYANSTIGGNVSIGKKSNVYMGSTIKNAITIGNSAEIEMGSVVIRNVEDNQKVFGNPARQVMNPKQN